MTNDDLAAQEYIAVMSESKVSDVTTEELG